MGVPFASLQMQIDTALGSDCIANKGVGLVAPYSSLEIDHWIGQNAEDQAFAIEEVWRYGQHLNLDDLDIGIEGIWATLRRVVGRRGLVVWKISRVCKVRTGTGIMRGDW